MGTNGRRHLLPREPRPYLATPLASGWWYLLSREDTEAVHCVQIAEGHVARPWPSESEDETLDPLSCAGLRWGVGSWGRDCQLEFWGDLCPGCC